MKPDTASGAESITLPIHNLVILKLFSPKEEILGLLG